MQFKRLPPTQATERRINVPRRNPGVWGTLYDVVGSVKGHLGFASREGSFFSSPIRIFSLSFSFIFDQGSLRKSSGGFWFHQPSIRSPRKADHDSFFRRRDRSREQGAQSG